MPAIDSTSKLFIGGLSSTTDESALQEYFEQWGGKIIDVVVMRDPTTKRSRGFGFVTFESDDQVDEAMTHRPHTVSGKEVDSKRAVPREFQNKAEAQISSKRIYLSGIKPEHTEDMLRNHFSKYGSVMQVDIAVDKKTGQRRGFAFVEFDDYDPADKAVLTKSHIIGGKRCDCRKALTKEELARVQQLEVDRQARGQRSRGPAGGGYGAEGNGGGPYYGSGTGYDSYGGRGPAQGPPARQYPPASYDYDTSGYGQGYSQYNPSPAYPKGKQEASWNGPPQHQAPYPPSGPQDWNAPPAQSYGNYGGQAAPNYGSGYSMASQAPARGYNDGSNGYNNAPAMYGNKGPGPQGYRNDASWGAPRNY